MRILSNRMACSQRKGRFHATNRIGNERVKACASCAGLRERARIGGHIRLTKGAGRFCRICTLAFTALAGCAILGGCATLGGERDLAVEQAGVAVPSDWAFSDAGAVPVDLSEYWTALGDPLLDDFVRQAIVENRDIALGIARLDQARAGLRLARAGYLPNVSGRAGVSRDVGDFAREEFDLSVGADVAWEADLFGRISRQVDASRADLAGAGYSLADVQRLIVGQVAIQTVQARAFAEQLAIARSILVFQDDNLQLARWRNQAGLVSSLDVEQARAQRAQTAATIPLLESNLVASANAIATLIGEAPGRTFEALTESEPQPVPIPPAASGFAAPAEVLRQRPDLRAAEADLIAAAARIGVARTDLLPAARISGTIATGATSLGGLFDIITGNLFAGLTQLIFDGGRTGARIDSAEAAARASLATYERTVLSALEEVETAAVDQRTADERVAITEEALDAANNSAFLARNQYEAGLTDFQRLLVVENQLLSARNQLVSAQADRATAFIRLTQALGGGWRASDYDFPLPAAYAAPGQARTAE